MHYELCVSFVLDLDTCCQTWRQPWFLTRVQQKMLHFTQINPLRDRWVFLAVIEVVEHCVMDAEVGGV